MNPAHKALRERTADAHARVDAVFARYDLTDRASYRAMLSAHLAVIGPLEQDLTLHNAQDVIEDWPERRRLDPLLLDLFDLGETRRSFGWIGAPVDEWSDARIAGTLYVLEGSRLGGKFLARQLPPDFPRRYLDTDQPPEKWRKLLDKLDTLLYQQPHLDSAVEAALAAFSAFERSGRKWLMKAS